MQSSKRFALFVALLCAFLAACSSTTDIGSSSGGTSTDSTSPGSTSTTSSSTSADTPTPLPPTVTPTPAIKNAPIGTVLFHSDVKTGFANWNPSGPWKIYNNYLLNDGTGLGTNCGADAALMAPYQPTTSDLAIDLYIQFPQNYNSGGTGMVARIGSVQNMVTGYSAEINYSGATINEVLTQL